MGEDDVLVSDIPLNLCFRYAFVPKASVSPYLRAGASVHLASGDYVESSDPGLIGALGIEFFRNRIVGLGLEVGYDTATLKIDDLTTANPDDTKDIEPFGLTVSIFAVF